MENLLQFHENSNIGFYMTQNQRLTYVNPPLSCLLGYEHPDELKEKPFLACIHQEDKDIVIRMLEREKGHPSSDRQPVRVLKKDGTFVWVLIDHYPTVFEGNPVQIGYVTDVNPLKETEKSLQADLEKYRTIFDEMADGVFEVDLKGNFTLVNQAAARIWGLSPEELLGNNARKYVDDKTARYVHESYLNVFKTGMPGKQIIFDVRREDGNRRVIDESVSPVRDKTGTIVGFRTISRDITERRMAAIRMQNHRMRLEAIFRSVMDAIITVDKDGRVLEANMPVEKICGVQAKNLVGELFTQYPHTCNKSCRDVLQHTLDKETAVKEYHIECDALNAPQQVVSVSSSPLLDPDGRTMGAVLVIRDITLLRGLERKLKERHQFQKIIGKNEKMQDIYSLLEDLADLETTVLVTGESGTGKDLIAKALHYTGQRAFKPFISVNCSALAESLLESELFGHVKGSFTGAVNDRQGRFQAAEGGTILLDEIGDISPMIQLKLLRVLQEKEFERVGESKPIKVDVRVIACTNKDLKEKVRKGEFREDLYYRLKVMELHVPPLRERQEDLPLLINHFCSIFNQKFEKDIEGVSGEVLKKFMDYHWPGNVRELEHVMERAFILCHGKVITLKHIPMEIKSYEISGNHPSTRNKPEKSIDAQDILDVLNKTRWNKARAARMLGMSRMTIYRKIEQYQLNSPE